MTAAEAVFVPMSFEQKLAALGKNRKYVLEKLKKIFPYEGFDPDKDHEREVGSRLYEAWTRASSWEFSTLFHAKFGRNHWLAAWFQSYVGGIDDPLNTLRSEWVEDSYHVRPETIRTSDIARKTAEEAITFHRNIRAQQDLITKMGIVYWSDNKDRLFPIAK